MIEEIKIAKENRKKILDFLYKERGRFGLWVDFGEIKRETDIAEDDLNKEIIYLYDKGLVEFPGNATKYDELLGSYMHISSSGIDLVEDPGEYGKLFSIKIHSNSFGNVNNSNVNIDSDNVQQMIKNETDPDLKLKLEELRDALGEKDKGNIIKALSYIGDKSVDLLIAIIAGSVK